MQETIETKFSSHQKAIRTKMSAARIAKAQHVTSDDFKYNSEVLNKSENSTESRAKHDRSLAHDGLSQSQTRGGQQSCSKRFVGVE